MLELTRLAKRVGPLDASIRSRSVESGVEISVAAPKARFSLRLDPFHPGQVAGFVLDQPINRFCAQGDLWSARLGPDEWLIGGPCDQGEAIEAEFARAFDNVAYALVDVSHRNVAIEVGGAGAAEALNAACPLDLDKSSFPSGMATRTIFGKAEIILFRSSETTFCLETWRSFATYVYALLHEATHGLRRAT